jgi:photosystem II stability/assembly factor-like uncharacterized protein
VRLPGRRQRLVAVGIVALVGLGGIVTVTRPSGDRKSVEVQAAGDSLPRIIEDPLPEFGPSTTSSSAPAPSSSSTTTATAAPTVVTTPKAPKLTTTTTAPPEACADADPIYAFGLVRRPDGNGWAAGGNPALQHTVDGGRTWTPACLPEDAVTGLGGFYGLVFAPDGDHGWMVGQSGGRPVALRTVDGGVHWKTATLPTGIAGGLRDVEFADLRHGWAVGNRTGTGPANAAGGVLLATSDGGATWTAQTVPPDVGRLTEVSVVDAVHGWAVGVAANGQPLLIATGDGGATWSSQTLPEGIRELRDVAFLDAERGWAVGARPVPQPAEPSQDDPGIVLTTADGGATWTVQASTTGSLWNLAIIDGQNLFAGGGYGLFSTHDGGGTWSKQPFTLPALDAISFTDATHGWVTHSMYSTVCRTDDGGRTWTASLIRPAPAGARPCNP